MPKYFFRLDDACPEMDATKFHACLDIFKRHGIAPLVGIIPENRDAALRRRPADPDFWNVIGRLSREKLIVIAQHGLHHRYSASRASLFFKYGIGADTEFAGLAYDAQLERLKRGRASLAGRGLATDIFMPPNHSFDRTTLRALRAAGFRYLSDGVGLYPYRRGGITFLPQLSGRPRRVLLGVTTVCLHPDTMTPGDLFRLDRFIAKHGGMSFEQCLPAGAPWYAPLVNGLVRVAFFIGKRIAASLRRTPRLPLGEIQEHE